MDAKKTIYSYSKIWNMEYKIYSIQNIHLPFPINPYDLLYFMLFGVIMYIFTAVSHISLPVALYLVIPYMAANFINKKKLDGKNPIKFFIDYIIYSLKKGTYIERWSKQNMKEIDKKIRINWKCSRRSNRIKGYRK